MEETNKGKSKEEEAVKGAFDDEQVDTFLY